jgi:DNA polymerase V
MPVNKTSKLTFTFLILKELRIPFINEGVSAGFPSPAADYEMSIDLNKQLSENPGYFYIKVKGL